MFHASDDTDIIKDYKTVVETQLMSEKRKFYCNFFFKSNFNSNFLFAENINFLTADGKRFAHPLHHLGKSQSDLPLIAIDSFRHMYLFPNYKDMYTSGKLKEFIADLGSGKLHR